MMNKKLLRKKIPALTAAVLYAACLMSGCSGKDNQGKTGETSQTEKETEEKTEIMSENDGQEKNTPADQQDGEKTAPLSTNETEIVDTDPERVDNEASSEETVVVNVSDSESDEDELNIIVTDEGENQNAASSASGSAGSTLAGFGSERSRESAGESVAEYAGEGEEMSEITEELQSESAENELNQELIRRLHASYLAQEEAAGALWSVSYEDLQENGEVIEYQADRKVLSASVIKVFIMGAVYDRICYPSEDMEPIGYTESYDGELGELLQQMITVSSNEAANRLVEILGDGSFDQGILVVNDFCTRHGYTHTTLGRRFLGSNENGDNYVSASDCRQILSDIYHGKLVNEEASEKMLNRLKAQTVKHKIPSGLPTGFTSANKTGEMPEGYGLGCIENDMAIVFTSQGDYILVVLSSELGGRNSQAQTTISAISSQTAQYYLEQHGGDDSSQAVG